MATLNKYILFLSLLTIPPNTGNYFNKTFTTYDTTGEFSEQAIIHPTIISNKLDNCIDATENYDEREDRIQLLKLLEFPQINVKKCDVILNVYSDGCGTVSHC